MRTTTLWAVALIATVTLGCGVALAKKPKGPNGIFEGSQGVVTLKYLGEGTVDVKLRTKYCALDSNAGATFVFPDGIHVTDRSGNPVLVIFYTPEKVVVYAEMKAFKQNHCKKGMDGTGVYKRKK